MRSRPTEQIPGVYHRRVGDLIVTAVSDGYWDGKIPLCGIEDEEIAKMVLAGTGSPVSRTSINVYAIRSEDRTILVDCGAGRSFGPTAGSLYDNLARAGIALTDVDAILLTHVHPDHVNGVTSDDGEVMFPNAEIFVHEAEYRHWFSDEAMATASDFARNRYFAGARFRLGPYGNRIRTFSSGEEFLPGIEAVACHGHTPGHTAYRLTSAGEVMLFWGDLVHLQEVQIPRPEITVNFDSDQGQAAESRRALFELLAEENIVVAGVHLHYPGFVRLAGKPGEYRLLAEPWVFTI